MGVSSGGDKGIPYALVMEEGEGGKKWKETIGNIAGRVWKAVTDKTEQS